MLFRSAADDAMQRSATVLREYGNVSSPFVCFVLEKALAEANEAVAMMEKNPAARDRLVIALVRRAEVHKAGREFEAARTDAERAVALNQELLGPEMLSSWSGRAYSIKAQAFRTEGKPSDACIAYASAVKHLEKGLGPTHPETVAAAQGVADCER